MEFRYAGFWLRLVATIIDTVILEGVSWGFALLLPDSIHGLHLQIAQAGIYAVFATPYFVWGQWKYQTTPGKRVLNLYVVRADDGLGMTLKQSWIRAFAYILSYLPLLCGYIMAAFHPKKQGLHDLIAGTIVVRQIGLGPYTVRRPIK